MHATGSVRTYGRGSVQLVVVAAVAVTGIAIGRWGIPADDAATITTSPRTDAVSTTDRFEAMAERKLTQMDARHSGHAHHTIAAGETTTVVPADATDVAPMPDSVVERKLSQTSMSSGALGDRANVASIPASAVERKLSQTSVSSGALRDRTNVASIPDSAVELKLEQTGTHSEFKSDAANVAPIPDSAVERKLEQTGTNGTPATGTRYEAMFETKSAQMDAREAR